MSTRGLHNRRMSSPVNTATTPGVWRAALTSMRLMRACANGLRTNAACSMLGQDEVVDVLAPPGQDPMVLDARNALTDESHDAASSGRLPRRTAASCTPATMDW